MLYIDRCPDKFQIKKMRRSAAPSKCGVDKEVPLLKKMKFTPPAITKCIPSNFNKNEDNITSQHDNLTHTYKSKLQSSILFNNVIDKHNPNSFNKKINDFGGNKQPLASFQTTTTNNSLNNSQSVHVVDGVGQEELLENQTAEVIPKNIIHQKKQFSLPLQTIQKQNSCTPKGGEIKDTNSSSRYLSVVWCKMSKKKHKKWEGDAVLVTHGRAATLYDMEGKVISKGSGYKTTELLSLKEDETLFIGGKEIQVMSELTEELFKSGKCFSVGSSTSNEELGTPLRKTISSKPFANPLKNTCGLMKKAPEMTSCSRFDPSAPGALVMLRPNSDHQWSHNKQSLPVTDVVVDPYISSSLRPHQKEGVSFLYECVMGLRDFSGHGAILADDMGLGKTLQCISVIWTLLKQGPYGGKPVIKKVIIITPGSLVKNWSQEFKKWLGVERLSVYMVSSDKKVQDFIKSNNYPVMIISYEMFVRYYEDLQSVTFDLVICDEGHRLKNTAIKTTSLIMSLASRRRIVLTGTPVQNDLQEFFSIVEFCNPGILGTSAAFRRVFEEPIVASRQPEATQSQKELGEDRAAELTRLTQMFVLRRTQEINNQYLPPKVELVIFCRPSPLQLSLYRQLIRCKLIRHCLSGNISGTPHLVCIGALKQLCNHPGLTYRKAAEASMMKRASSDGEDMEDSIYDGLLSYFPEDFDASTVTSELSGKLEVLSQILSSIWEHSSSEKVVLVSNHTRTLDFLQVFCDLQGYTYLRLDGSTPTGQRQDIVNKFNSKFSSQRIFLLSSKAGGVGLNLIGASRLILYDIDWNPANDLQAMARVWRDGQTKKVHIYRLLTVGTIEEKIYQRQVTKQGLSETVMDLCSKTNVKFSLEDLKDLFTLNEDTDCETHAMLTCPCEGNPDFVDCRKPEAEVEESRVCQLGVNVASRQKKQVNLTMAELLHWKHWQGHFVRDEKTWYLDKTGNTVSYVFWHEINQSTC